jgi:hypothetical protein
MTWVIGASSIFDYGAMMSDVRVTFRDGRERDLVQKAYPVGPYIVAGFAGSVRIGFQMLESLAKFLIVPPNAPQPGAWEPEAPVATISTLRSGHLRRIARCGSMSSCGPLYGQSL